MIASWRDTSFGRLTWHFFIRFFESGSGSSDARFGVGAVLALLTIPGALMTFVLFGKYSSVMRFFQRSLFTFDPAIASISDKYTFLAYAMAITGIVAVLRWDTLFPDRRDFLNLSPLPLQLSSILAAKLIALGAFVIIFVIDTNLVATVLFPMIVMESSGTVGDVLRFIAAHAISVAAAALFTFSTLLGLSGTVMAILPYGFYRRVRRYIQFVCVTVLLLLFFSSTLLPPELEKIRLGQHSWAEWLPTLWFLGLYQELHGHNFGRFPELAQLAMKALAISIAAALAGYALSYRLCFLRSAETQETIGKGMRTPEWLLSIFDRFVLHSGFDRACFRFILRTLSRSDRHGIILAGALGLGFSVVVQALATGNRNPAVLFSTWTILTYSLLAGLRLSLGVPSEIPANWIFQFMTGSPDDDPRRVVRFMMLAAATPLVLLSTALFWWLYGPFAAGLHVLFASVCSAVLVQVFTSDFRVIPFTCSWLPGKSNPVLAVAAYLAGLVTFGHGLAVFEYALLNSPKLLYVFAFLAGGFSLGLARLRDNRAPLVFHDTRGEFDLIRISE